MTDEALLELAAGDGRVMVMFNVADFPDLARRWAEEHRSHAGVAIIVGIDHAEFGSIPRALARYGALVPATRERAGRSVER